MKANVTLPDGVTVTRTTDHVYTHAVAALQGTWDDKAGAWAPTESWAAISFHHTEEAARKNASRKLSRLPNCKAHVVPVFA